MAYLRERKVLTFVLERGLTGLEQATDLNDDK